MKVVINSQKEIEALPGKSLLETLKNSGVFIPSGCGGKGACGMCRVKVLSGEFPPLTKTEAFWLTPSEKAENFRLACRILPTTDVGIELPESVLAIRAFETEVVSLRDLTYDIKEIRLKLLNPTEMSFSAGQFIQILIPAYGNSQEPVYRSYSLATDPSVKSEICLFARFVPNGISTTYIHKYMKVGEKVTINGPHGQLHLRDSAKDIVFIAGGSGMSPIRSMLLDMRSKGIQRRATYFFGAKTRRDLFLLDEMADFEKTLTGFKFVPALSDQEPTDDWNGERGLITEVVARHLADAANKEAYLCGSPPMVSACIKTLKAAGMPDSSIFFDKFV